MRDEIKYYRNLDRRTTLVMLCGAGGELGQILYGLDTIKTEGTWSKEQTGTKRLSLKRHAPLSRPPLSGWTPDTGALIPENHRPGSTAKLLPSLGQCLWLQGHFGLRMRTWRQWQMAAGGSSPPS